MLLLFFLQAFIVTILSNLIQLSSIGTFTFLKAVSLKVLYNKKTSLKIDYENILGRQV